MENALVKSPIAEKYLPAKVNLAQLQKIDEVTGDFFEIVTADEKSPAAALIRACAMQQLRDLLTDTVMQPIMGLQGNKLGFITDRDKKKIGAGNYVKGDGYPVEIVRDVTIWAAGNGARMVNNEVNILAGNGYLTREYFGRKLDDLLGAENWSIIPEVPHVTRANDGKIGGAIVTGKLWWRDSAGEHTETLTLAIKGDEYASADAYIGKFERKARKFILERCTRRRYSDGEAGEIIEGVATEIDDPPRKSPLESRHGRKAGIKPEPKPEPDEKKAEKPEAVQPEPKASAPEGEPASAPVDEKPAEPKKTVQPDLSEAAAPTDEDLLAAELTRRGEFVTVETIRNFALDNGYEFDAKSALENLDAVLETMKANGGK